MYYNYVDHRADAPMDDPFYCGLGDECRVADFKNRNDIWQEITAEHGVRREIVLVTSVYDVVCSNEIDLIRDLKTHVSQGGANKTLGGEGCRGWHPSEQTRLHMREAKLGKKFEPEHKANMSLAHIERYKSEDARLKTSEQQIRAWSDPTYHERMRLTRVGERNSHAVITENDVRDLRSTWSTYDASKRGATKTFCVEHGRRLGVTPENVFGIVKRRSWKHVT